MSKKRLYAHVVLDRSGSMADGRDATISAFNEYVTGLAADADLSVRLSLTIFDSQSIDLIIDNQKIKDVPKLTRDTFVPRASTPLNDAIGKTVAAIDAQTRREGENVALVILTDGQENASREFNKVQIKALLDQHQKDKNWLVIYLGADHDAFAEAANVGISAMGTMSFDKSSVSATMSAAVRGVSDYAKSGLVASAAFTDSERHQASLKRK